MGFGGVSPCLGDPPNEAARPGTQHRGRSSFGHHHVLRLKMTAFGPPPTPARCRGAPRHRRRPPAELRRGGCLLPPPFLLFLLLFASSPPFSSLSFLCKLKCVNETERERVLVAWRCFVRGFVLTYGPRWCGRWTTQHTACYSCPDFDGQCAACDGRSGSGNGLSVKTSSARFWLV